MRSNMHLFPVIAIVLFGACFTANVDAKCECGYSLSPETSSDSIVVFTDMVESDFLHIRDVAVDTDWQRQNFTKTPEAGRGPYGMNFTIGNVFSNPIPDHRNWTGPGTRGGDPGVELVVTGGVPRDGYVELAQMDTLRSDMLWGSYRAGMKLSSVAGTCAAFFWYFNDSQEIDMEFLSKDFDYENKRFPVNLIMQTPKSAAEGFSEVGANNYIVANLSFDPTAAYHEYRMDLLPGRVVFYADTEELATMITPFEPTEAGHMILTHWSNGNPTWTDGPPVSDATISVSYVKAYFNSSDSKRQLQSWSRCDLRGKSTEPVCNIPDQTFAPDLKQSSPANGSRSAAEVMFFTDEKDTSKGQIYFDKNGTSMGGVSGIVFVGLLLAWVMVLADQWY